MKIIRIFAQENTSKGLFAIKCDTEDEFTKCADRWMDIEYLFNFFDDNETNLNNGYYEDYIPVSDAVSLTRNEAYELLERIANLAKQTLRSSKKLSHYFRPLIGGDAIHEFLQEEKASSQGNLRCLRLYAIKISEETYVITGGAIKLVGKMSESQELIDQLALLRKTRKFLKEQNVFCQEDFEEFMKSQE